MNLSIPRNEWKNFFDDLSKRRFEWKTDLEVVGRDLGDQILSDGLPLNGITVEDRNGETAITILTGGSPDEHQSHTVLNPVAVGFYARGGEAGGIIEIEDGEGTQVLLRLKEPGPVELGYGAYKVTSA